MSAKITGLAVGFIDWLGLEAAHKYVGNSAVNNDGEWETYDERNKV
jgi:hypothetical protein